MKNVRVIEIPPLQGVISGKLSTIEEVEAYDRWWSSLDRGARITPDDFMWYNAKQGHWEWFVAVPAGIVDSGGYKRFEFVGGLYAVAAAKDADEEEALEVHALIRSWVEATGAFACSTSENDPSERYVMSHVTTPKVFKERMGYHLADIFVPIVER